MINVYNKSFIIELKTSLKLLSIDFLKGFNKIKRRVIKWFCLTYLFMKTLITSFNQTFNNYTFSKIKNRILEIKYL